MNTSNCPQCKIEINNSSNRLFQDECGHKKCRKCVIQDVLACHTCQKNEKLTTVSIHTSNVSVIKYDGINKSSDNISKNDELDTYSQSKTNYECTQKSYRKPTNGTGFKKIKRQYKSLVIPSHIIVLTSKS